MASAKVGSPMTSCQALMGNWLVIRVDPRPYRSSTISIRSRRCVAVSRSDPQSSIARQLIANAINERGGSAAELWGCCGTSEGSDCPSPPSHACKHAVPGNGQGMFTCPRGAVGQFQFFEEARHPFVDHGDAITTGRLRQGTAEPGLSDLTGAGPSRRCKTSPARQRMIRLRLSVIHLPVTRLWNSALSRPCRAR